MVEVVDVFFNGIMGRSKCCQGNKVEPAVLDRPKKTFHHAVREIDFNPRDNPLDQATVDEGVDLTVQVLRTAIGYNAREHIGVKVASKCHSPFQKRARP